jgi:hypothetical protein
MAHSSGAAFRPSLPSLGLPTVSSKALRISYMNRILPACGNYCSITARPSFRTIAVFHSPIFKQPNGAFRRLGITLGPFQCSRASISPEWQSCFKMPAHLSSASDTGGARTSRTSCSPKGARRFLAMSSQHRHNQTLALRKQQLRPRRNTKARWRRNAVVKLPNRKGFSILLVKH